MGNREEEQKAFFEELGAPHHFEPDGQNAGSGRGYWRVTGGFFSFQRNGENKPWLYHSRVEYAEENIQVLYALLSLPKHPVIDKYRVATPGE